LIVLLGLGFWASLPARTTPIPIGLLSFDVFTLAANGSSGVNAINISDFTGTFDLPPDFPASTALTLLNATLTANQTGGPSLVVPLGNIEPGPLLDPGGNPLPALLFPDTINLTSVSFTAALSPTTFLVNGNAFVAAPAISVTLSPASGSFVIAGIDNVLIMADPASAVPEPRTLILLGPVSIVGALLLALTLASNLHKVTERSIEL
jgi:hypothetical protein